MNSLFSWATATIATERAVQTNSFRRCIMFVHFIRAGSKTYLFGMNQYFLEDDAWIEEVNAQALTSG